MGRVTDTVDDRFRDWSRRRDNVAGGSFLDRAADNIVLIVGIDERRDGRLAGVGNDDPGDVPHGSNRGQLSPGLDPSADKPQ